MLFQEWIPEANSSSQVLGFWDSAGTHWDPLGDPRGPKGVEIPGTTWYLSQRFLAWILTFLCIVSPLCRGVALIQGFFSFPKLYPIPVEGSQAEEKRQLRTCFPEGIWDTLGL